MIFLFPSVNIFITESGASKQLLNICLESALEQSRCQQPSFPSLEWVTFSCTFQSVPSAMKCQ